MTAPPYPIRHHRGVALLIVLGVMLIVVTASAIIATTAADVSVQRTLANGDHTAFDVLTALDAPLHHWLENESSKVVLAPDAAQPAVMVLDDQFELDGVIVRVRLTAFDQLGMVPIQAARSASPLRLALPGDLAAMIDQIELPPSSDKAPLGLDLVTAQDRAGATGERTLQVFPTMHDAGLGGFVATHNRGRIRININTAPRPLLAAAMRLGGRGDIDRILALRSDAKPGTLEAAPTPRTRAASEHEQLIPNLVTASDCWAFRIDIDVGSLKRSWWTIYQPGPDDPRTYRRERWRCVQRLAISS